MSTTNPTSETRTTRQQVKAHLNQWESGVDRLADEVRQVSQEAQKEYVDQIAVLRQHLKELRLRWQAIEEGEPQEWRESRPAFQQRLTRFRQVFMQTANKLHREDQVDLGWLEGFTNERTHESVSWAESQGHRSQDSKGWAEGYDQVNKN